MTNIPGTNIKYGTEVMQYVTPFSLEFNEAGEFITEAGNSSHPLVLAVFKQERGKIVVEETQAGCTKDIVEPRIVDYTELQAKYSLELLAGNWLYMPYSGQATHAMVCRISKCTGQAWPFPIPGINDLEECQPRTDIVDFTTRGPARGKEMLYSKYTSKFSPDSVTHIIQVRGVELVMSTSAQSDSAGHGSWPLNRKGYRVHGPGGSLQWGTGLHKQPGHHPGRGLGRHSLHLQRPGGVSAQD